MIFDDQFFFTIRMNAVKMILDRKMGIWDIEEFLSEDTLSELFSDVATKARFAHLPASDALEQYFREVNNIIEILDDLDIDQGRFKRGYRGISETLEELEDEQLKGIIKYIKAGIYQFVSCRAKSLEKLPSRSRFHEIARMFSLDERTLSIFAFLAFYRTYNDFFSRNNIKDSHLYKLIKQLFHISEYDLQRLIALDGPLAKKGLTVAKEGPARSGFESEINTAIYNYLCEYSSTPYDERIMSDARPGRFDVASFEIPGTDVQIFKKLVARKGPSNILLYGPPGAGKTEFALAASAGSRPLVFKAGDAKAIEQFAIALTVSAFTNRTLIVDEADQLLITMNSFFFTATSGQKKLVNELLDNSMGKCIFISNSIKFIDPSTLRRFHQIIRFPELIGVQRKKMWNVIASHHQLDVEKQQIDQYVSRYKVTPGIINLAVENAKAMDGENQEVIITRTIENYLKACGEKIQKVPDPSTAPPFDMSLLNVDISDDELQLVVEPYIENNELPGTALLFWGPPGTGKSAVGRHLAERIGYEFMYRRMSDLLSPYVGENEQNIASMFEEASKISTVLMIDEADSLMRNRRTAVRGWESSLVNEFLSQLEAAQGIVICTTNLLDDLDPAALRRFPWKIGFKTLPMEAVRRACRLYFPDQFEADDPSPELSAGLTLGDFGAVHRKLIPRLLSNPHRITRAQIIQALITEKSYRESERTSTVRGFSIS